MTFECKKKHNIRNTYTEPIHQLKPTHIMCSHSVREIKSYAIDVSHTRDSVF